MTKYQTWSDWCLRNPMIFPVLPDCAGYPFEMSRIYPTKQREVRAVYELLKPLAFIKRVFIFGSSTNNKCTLQSDLDIVIESDLTESIEDRACIQKHLYVLCKNGYDLLWMEDVHYGTDLYANMNRGVRII